MDQLGSIAAFLGGVGAGSTVTALIQHFLARRSQRADLLHSNRTKAFTGVLRALEALEVSHTQEKAKSFGYWVCRTQLVASDRVVEAISRMRATDPMTPQREQAMQEMLGAMRADLDMR